eukprot:TRINITY_DN13012_c0_g2_i7.p1 TRINITY_DN13012_c0_g2~~TRINITY_DN13012_c0_g2_i7.p1  ORF type:complete len:225 (+),score=45.49 TRINITY_DN13012_c0_g2_i7:617-1291(+)
MQMLNAARRMKCNGQSADHFLGVIRKQQRKTIDAMKKMSGKSELKFKGLKNISKKGEKKPSTFKASSIKDGMKRVWVSNTDIKKSIRVKEDLLKWLKKETKLHEFKNIPKRALVTAQTPSSTKKSIILSPGLRNRTLKEDPKKAIVRLDKRFNMITPRYTNYSLTIGSIGASVPRSYTSLDNPTFYATPAYSSKSIETFVTAASRVKTPHLALEKKGEQVCGVY